MDILLRVGNIAHLEIYHDASNFGIILCWVDGDALILEINSVGSVQDDPVVKICM